MWWLYESMVNQNSRLQISLWSNVGTSLEETCWQEEWSSLWMENRCHGLWKASSIWGSIYPDDEKKNTRKWTPERSLDKVRVLKAEQDLLHSQTRSWRHQISLYQSNLAFPYSGKERTSGNMANIAAFFESRFTQRVIERVKDGQTNTTTIYLSLILDNLKTPQTATLYLWLLQDINV